MVPPKNNWNNWNWNAQGLLNINLKDCNTTRYNASKTTTPVIQVVGKGKKWIHFLLLKT